MDKLILSLDKRVTIPVVCAFSLVSWLALCQANYKSYWEGTIYKVQTVDFNILHHTLPCTLSVLVAAGRDDLVQEVLDSNYGIFGLVVTNASGSSIIYKTSKVYHRQSWQKLITPEYLGQVKEPYDLLTNPPPMGPVYAHSGPRQPQADKVSKETQGRVLGRIYYVRQPPPSFAEDLSSFLLSGFTELSGAKRGYLLIMLTVTWFSLALIALILWRKGQLHLQIRELEHQKSELEIRKKALDNLSLDLREQKARKDWLEAEADRAYRGALLLKETLQKLKLSLKPQLTADNLGQAAIKIRPPVHTTSVLISEIESLLPEISGSAEALKTQAKELQENCAELTRRQLEMKRILERSALPLTGVSNLVQFRPK